ncbi:MAG: hypothetical protein LBN06_04995 [Prevotellaceae bacterium]|jgi:hypothetical protein|nr:hypothetical protein [Prevotellaceae bacterium]
MFFLMLLSFPLVLSAQEGERKAPVTTLSVLSATALAQEAEAHFLNGEENVAARLYEEVLSVDANHLQANIFLANYYYLLAEREKSNLESDYHKLRKPTRRQRAQYHDSLSGIVSSHYHKAKVYLQRVLQLYPSTGAEQTIEKIGTLEANLR